MYIVGLMSGTSGDGVDAALVDITGRDRSLKARTLAAHTLAYPRSLQQRILSASVSGTVADVCHLNALLGEWFANAALHVIRQAKLQPSNVALIGSHGQTVHHLPHGIHAPGVGAIRSTLQIAEPAVIAERTGITTVANFRSRDIAAGGQGAPLDTSSTCAALEACASCTVGGESRWHQQRDVCAERRAPQRGAGIRYGAGQYGAG